MSYVEDSSPNINSLNSSGSIEASAVPGLVTSFNSRLFETPQGPTQFERKVESLNLQPQEYLYSTSLREWVKRNRKDRYVPSDLLQQWGFE